MNNEDNITYNIYNKYKLTQMREAQEQKNRRYNKNKR